MRLPRPSRTLQLSLALAATLCAQSGAAAVPESAAAAGAEKARREKAESLISVAHPRGICPSVMRGRTLAGLDARGRGPRIEDASYAGGDDAPVVSLLGRAAAPHTRSDDGPDAALNATLVRGPRRPTCLMPLPFTPVDKPEEKTLETELIAAHGATPR